MGCPKLHTQCLFLIVLGIIHIASSELFDLNKIPFPWGRPEESNKPKEGSSTVVGGLKSNERILKFPGKIENLPTGAEYAEKVLSEEWEKIPENEKTKTGQPADHADVFGAPAKPVSVFELKGDPELSWSEEYLTRPYQFVGVMEDTDGTMRWFAKKRPRFYKKKKPFYMRIIVPNREGMIQYLLSTQECVLVEQTSEDPGVEPSYRMAKRKKTIRERLPLDSIKRYFKANILQNPDLRDKNPSYNGDHLAQ
mmetsp:Transcript_4684/g.6437  ORF Transcript_4684/g.6437 Transcript_4684/m.6437 type:complete len:252 (+) Transcript_4684:52-807(+)